LSFVLRHQPGSIGLALDPHSRANIEELIRKGNAAGTQFNREDLLQHSIHSAPRCLPMSATSVLMTSPLEIAHAHAGAATEADLELLYRTTLSFSRTSPTSDLLNSICEWTSLIKLIPICRAATP
jgi:hypothetical protein